MNAYGKMLDNLVALSRAEGWCSGTRLPPERELAVMLGASRPTLRKILERFEVRGVLKRRRRGGTFLLDNLDPAIIGDGASSYMISFVAPLGVDGDGFSGRQRYLQERLLSHGCVLNAYLANRDGQDPEKECQYLRSLFKVRPKGMIIVPTPIGGGNADILSQLAQTGLRIVHIDHYRDSLPAEPFVLPDWRFAGAQAVSFLSSRGAKKVVLANPCGDSPGIRRIIEGIESMTTMLGMGKSFLGVECAGRDRGTGTLRKAVRNLSRDTGVLATHPESAKMILEQNPALAPTGRIISVAEYDCGTREIPSHPILAFSWMERAEAALDYILAPGKTEAPRQLLKPRLLAWDCRKGLKKRY